MADSLHQITIEANERTLYQALTTDEGISGWWTRRCELANQEGESSYFWFGEQRPTRFVMRSQKMLPNKRIFLVCTDGPEEWIGTELWWEIQPLQDDKCQLDFKHMNWKRDDGLFPEWNSIWGKLMTQLKHYCENVTQDVNAAPSLT